METRGVEQMPVQGLPRQATVFLVLGQTARRLSFPRAFPIGVTSDALGLGMPFSAMRSTIDRKPAIFHPQVEAEEPSRYPTTGADRGSDEPKLRAQQGKQ